MPQRIRQQSFPFRRRDEPKNEQPVWDIVKDGKHRFLYKMTNFFTIYPKIP